MKNIRAILIADIIVLFIKIFSGYLVDSNALIFSGLFELIIAVYLIFSMFKKNNTFKNIITLLMSIVIVGGVGYRLFISFRVLIGKISEHVGIDGLTLPSLWIILFLLLILIVRYIVQVFITAKAFNNKGGLLSISNIKSNTDFYMVGIILLSVILSHLGKIKALSFLLYSYILGEIIILLFVLVKGIKLLISSIKALGKEFIIPEEYRNEIQNRKEVKRINNLSISNFGGIRISKVVIELNGNVSMIDANTFVLTLQDYLLKISDVVEIWLGSSNNIIGNAMQRRINNAGNSRGRNSSSNSKRKNNRKKNR